MPRWEPAGPRRSFKRRIELVEARMRQQKTRPPIPYSSWQERVGNGDGKVKTHEGGF